jgi:hypothetical protein
MKTLILTVGALALMACGEGEGEGEGGVDAQAVCARMCTVFFECDRDPDRGGPGEMREFMGKCTEECGMALTQVPDLAPCYDMITSCEPPDQAAQQEYFECLVAADPGPEQAEARP